MKKKPLGEILVEPITTSSVSVTASGPWGEEEKEFIYPATISTPSVTASLAHELGTEFKPKDKKQITEIIDHAKMYFSEFEGSISLSALSLKGEIKLRFKREPKKTIKIFQER
jgi:hypothetical protein